jgi:hypothetical protein
MTTYSLLIETDSLQELHAMLGVFLEATRSPKQEASKEQVNTPGKDRSGPEEAKKAICAYCDHELVGLLSYQRNSKFFCCLNCADLYDSPIGQYIKNHESLITGPLMANDLPGKENIPFIDRSCILADPAKLQAYIKMLADLGFIPNQILLGLKLHGVEMSPAELGSILQEMT